MSKRALEQYRVFPFLAWSLVIGFSFFVYQLTAELKSVNASFAEQTGILEARANQDPAQITNFER